MRWSLFSRAALLLASCAQGPTVHLPAPPIPANWPNPVNTISQSDAANADRMPTVNLLGKGDFERTPDDLSIGAPAKRLGLALSYFSWEVDFGELEFDASKPDGTPRKLLDASALAKMGWRSRIDLRAGIASTYADYRASAHADLA